MSSIGGGNMFNPYNRTAGPYPTTLNQL